MPEKPEEVVARCLRDFEEDEIPHRAFCDQVEKRYRAYRGILDIRQEAAAWTSRHAPKYVLQVIEMMVSNLLDPLPVWKLRARPRYDTQAEVERYTDGARANELLLAEQLEGDHYAEKQRPFGLQGLIAGLSVKKNYWAYREETVRIRETVEEPLYHPVTGQVVAIRPVLREVERREAVRDDPTSEVVDVRDFVWHQAAVSLAKALRVTHRVWYSYDELEELQRQGVYGPEAGGQDVALLKESRDLSGSYTNRERELFGSDRTKDMIEVLEQWRDRGRRVVSIGNRRVLLGQRPHPFWFERLEHPFPFVVCSSMPDMFMIPGISEVELMMDIQDMLWSLEAQQLDAVQLLANPIMLVSGGGETSGWEWAPGEFWVSDDPNAAKPLEINPAIADLASASIARLTNVLQNVAGASPTLMGQVDPSTQTATEISLVTSMAQRRIAAKKVMFSWSQQRDGEQWIALNQQFVRSSRLVEVLGANGARQFHELHPEMLRGSYSVQLSSVDESLMRQERRAEKSALFQVVMGSLAGFAALHQADPSVPVPNAKAFLDDLMEEYGITGDKGRYYLRLSPPPQALPPVPQAPAANQSPFGQGAGNGVTAPQAYDMNAPSNAASQSPVAALQRLGALTGGPVNVRA